MLIVHFIILNFNFFIKPKLINQYQHEFEILKLYRFPIFINILHYQDMLRINFIYLYFFLPKYLYQFIDLMNPKNVYLDKLTIKMLFLYQFMLKCHLN